ncbi:MAG: preprotein translocase subunit SecE [Deltaproteobacteria bacterium]|nr:preprotein translocase subunit SecE [Deltaproteobacteria bacterium]
MSTQTETRAAGSLQLGVQKYLYTGYFVGAVVVAFLVKSTVDRFWEGHDTASTLIGAVGGVVALVWAWKNVRLRTLAKECIDELAAVTWPTRQETQTATAVVLIASVISAGMIFGLDRFWNWLTNWLFR